MPEASRHAKSKPVATKLRASILAAAALAGAVAAFAIIPGGHGAAKPSVPVTSAAAVSGGDQDNPANIRYELDSMSARLVIRARAVTRHHHVAEHAVSRQGQAPAAPPAQPAPAATAATAHGGKDAASSPLGICVRRAEEGGSYAWGPGNGGGAYQFELGTWEKYGGAASEYGVAGPAYQDQIFDNAIAAGGASNWTAYDGC